MKVALTVAIVSLMVSMPVIGSPLGWRWYNTPTPEEDTAPPPDVLPAVTVTTVMTPTEQMAWFHQYQQHLYNDAFIHPQDVDKGKKVLWLNQFVSDHASRFGMTMKQALLEEPSLSYTREHPTQQAARQAYLASIRRQKTAAVEQLVRDGYGLFFIYRGHDVLASALAPSLQAFADRYGIDLLGVSLEPPLLDSIRKNRANQGRLVIDCTPALILVNPRTQVMKPLAYGFISQEALLGRFLNVATGFAADF